jgi:hypothetical protein
MGEDVAARRSSSESLRWSTRALYVLKHDDLFAVFNACGDFHGLMHNVGPSTEPTACSRMTPASSLASPCISAAFRSFLALLAAIMSDQRALANQRFTTALAS